MSKKRTRKIIQSSLATAVAVSTVAAIAPNTEAAVGSFNDVSADSYYFNAVQQLTQKGVISGYPDGTFKPNNAVTRAEFTAFLVKMLQLDTNSVSNPNFPDVHTNAWYYSSVATLANLGLVGGYEDGSFQPNKTITRAEIAALLTRICDLKADSNTALPFTDVPANAWYKDVVTALYQSKLVSGKTLTTFAPNDNATRAEATVFLQRAEAAGLLPTTPKAPEATATIEALTNESVTIDGVTYKFADGLKGIFNAANSAALTNAKVAFTAANKVITKIESLEINASGQAVTAKDEEEFSKNVVFDGGKTTIDGLFTINGNYVSIKNLTVSGKTIINGTNNVFFDAKLSTVEITKKDAAVTLKGSTVKDLIIPVGTKAKDYIKNYDDVKKNIAKINGKTNPDAAVGGGGGGGGTGTGNTPNINDGKTINGNYEINITENSEVFGPASGQTEVTGTLTIKLDKANPTKDINLRNIKAKDVTIVGSAAEKVNLSKVEITGTLSVDIKNGSISLDGDSSVGGSTDIIDVAYGTFSSSATHTGKIDVKDASAAIELKGDASNARLEISGGGTIKLVGEFKGEIIIKSSVVLDLPKDTMVSNITIQAETPVKVAFNGEGVKNIEKIDIKSDGVKLGGEGLDKIKDKIDGNFAELKDPIISKISFGEVTSVINHDENRILADLRNLTANAVFSATVGVTQDSNLQFSVKELGTIGDFDLVANKDNSIYTVDFSKLNADNIEFENIKFENIVDEALKANIDKAALYDAIELGTIFETVSVKDPETLQKLLDVVDIGKILTSIKGTSAEEQVYSAIEFDKINNAIAFTDFVDAFDVLGVIANYKDDIEKIELEDLSNPENVIDKINRSAKKTEIYSDLFALINFDEMFSTLLTDPKYDKETVKEVFKALHVGNILNTLNNENYNSIISQLDFNSIFVALNKSTVRSEIFNSDVIDLSKIFDAVGRAEGFTKSLFQILEELDGKDDETLTVGAKLYNEDGETNYTLEIKVGD